MGKSMTPSAITPGQIAKLLDLQAAALRKSGLPSEPTQQVLESQGAALANEFVASVRKRVEAIFNLIVRRAKADRSRTPEQALAATGRRQYVDDGVVATMPRGKGAKVETVFFKLDLSERGSFISDDDLEKEFELRNLEPEYPDSLAAINEDDPAFADEHPNCTHWKDANGKWCYAAFRRWGVDERDVDVRRLDYDWAGYWWFAGRRK